MHTSLLTDDKILSLSPADRWAWVALAAHTREHGETGRMTVDPRNPFLALIFGCSQDEVLPTIQRLPNVLIEESENCNTKITLHFKNWRKYAEDNSLERVRKHRSLQKRNATEERRREEKRGDKKRGEENIPPTPLKRGEGNDVWPSPKLLIELYNKEAADELPAVERLTPARTKRANEYLRVFPGEDFWYEVFQETKKSSFLRGLRPTTGHESFRASLDWLLTKGKDGIENAVKVFEGRYRDA